MEYLIIALFSLILMLTMLLELNLLVALSAGYILFFLYALHKGCFAKELIKLSFDSVRNIGSLLILFCLIGVLTASWRASGSIAYIAVKSSSILIPSLFLLSTFILCSFVSFLTGTSVGTSASIGLVCMTMGNILAINPAFLGGAIISGSFFGDRMSPMSSSAHLVAKVTTTDIFMNLKNMFSTCVLAFVISCGIYLFLGYENSESTVPYDTLELFKENFNLSWIVSIPVFLVLFLASLRVNIVKCMLASVVSASIICVYMQNMSFIELLEMFCFGFESSNKEVDILMGGGGFSSMILSVCIIAISSSYVGIFNASGFFETMHVQVAKLEKRMTVFGATSIVAVLSCMLVCTQTLAIFLTKSLCEKMYIKKEKLAHAIEDTVILFSGIVPWNVACSLVLTNIDAPKTSVFYAFLIYLIPLYSFFKFRKEDL